MCMRLRERNNDNNRHLMERGVWPCDDSEQEICVKHSKMNLKAEEKGKMCEEFVAIKSFLFVENIAGSEGIGIYSFHNKKAKKQNV